MTICPTMMSVFYARNPRELETIEPAQFQFEEAVPDPSTTRRLSICRTSGSRARTLGRRTQSWAVRTVPCTRSIVAQVDIDALTGEHALGARDPRQEVGQLRRAGEGLHASGRSGCRSRAKSRDGRRGSGCWPAVRRHHKALSGRSRVFLRNGFRRQGRVQSRLRSGRTAGRLLLTDLPPRRGEHGRAVRPPDREKAPFRAGLNPAAKRGGARHKGLSQRAIAKRAIGLVALGHNLDRSLARDQRRHAQGQDRKSSRCNGGRLAYRGPLHWG